MNELTTFNFGTTQVRTARTEAGDPLFCLADICKCLEITNPSMTATQICEEFACPKLNLGHIFDSLNREQEATFITEPQLYFVMMRSRSEHARDFRQWICNEVLPSIRKTGAYNAPAVVKSAPAIALTDKLNAAKIILGTAGIEGNQLTLALDKVYHHETNESLLQVTGTNLVAPEQSRLLNPTEVGQLFGMNAIKLNKLFAKFGLQVKLPSGKWELTELGRANGGVLLDVNKAHMDGTPVQQIKWDARILNFLKKVVDKVE